MRVVVMMLAPSGCGLIPWITIPTSPPRNLCSWFPIFVVSPFPFVHRLCPVYRSQRLDPLVEMIVAMETNGERETSAKRTSLMHPQRRMT